MAHKLTRSSNQKSEILVFSERFESGRYLCKTQRLPTDNSHRRSPLCVWSLESGINGVWSLGFRFESWSLASWWSLESLSLEFVHCSSALETRFQSHSCFYHWAASTYKGVLQNPPFDLQIQRLLGVFECHDLFCKTPRDF